MSTRGKKRASPRKKEESEPTKMEYTSLQEEEKAGGPIAGTAKKMKTTAAGAPKNLLSLFLKTPLDDHLPRQAVQKLKQHMAGDVVVARLQDSVPSIFRRLAREQILSAPVVDADNHYLGFVHMLDLVRTTTEMFYGETEEQWIDWWEKEDDFVNQIVMDVYEKPGVEDRMCAPGLQRDFTSFAALEQLARSGKHRVAITDAENTVTGILTNSMIISWLRQNKALYSTLRTMLVSDITSRCTQQNLVTIQETETALQAFLMMDSRNISGLPVVNEDGLLVGNISVTDLRGVGTSGEYFFRLFSQIKDYKKVERKEFSQQAPTSHYSKKKVPAHALYLTADSTFEDVIDMMNDGNIHRVYVCDERPDSSKPYPTHVISQTDICKIVLDHCIELSDQVPAA